MDSLKELTTSAISFRDARDWKQFHKAKDLALSLLLEASELAEHFQWKNEAEISQHLDQCKEQVADELADVLTYLDLLAAVLGVNLGQAAVEKFNEVSERVGFTDRIELK